MTIATASPLLTAPIGPTIIRLAAPNMIAMVVTMVTLMGEAWYVGRLGTESLAGLALAFPMMMLVMMLSAGSFGGTITGAVARRLGAGDRPGAEALAFHAVLLAVLLAGACTLVFLLGGRRIYSLLGGSGAVLAQALAYSDVLFLGCIAMWLANALASIVRATGHMQVAAKGLVAGSVLQVMAAGVLVFGLGPLLVNRCQAVTRSFPEAFTAPATLPGPTDKMVGARQPMLTLHRRECARARALVAAARWPPARAGSRPVVPRSQRR
jgi:Na+-driven multidrug efflux pump